MTAFMQTVNTAATGAAAMWVFMVFVWPKAKTAVMAWVAAEAAKFAPPKP